MIQDFFFFFNGKFNFIQHYFSITLKHYSKIEGSQFLLMWPLIILNKISDGNITNISIKNKSSFIKRCRRPCISSSELHSVCIRGSIPQHPAAYLIIKYSWIFARRIHGGFESVWAILVKEVSSPFGPMIIITLTELLSFYDSCKA